MTAAEYKPKFRDDVTTDVGGRPQTVAPKQVLTEDSAKELQAILAAEGPDYAGEIVRDSSGAIIGHPITYKGGLKKDTDGNWIWDQHGATPSAQAPHLVFADGTIVNAGLVADYWNRHVPNPGDKVVVALRDAKIEIDGERENQKGSQQ